MTPPKMVLCAATWAPIGLLVSVSSTALTLSPPVLETYGHAGQPAIGPCTGPVLSETGRYLSFACRASDMVPEDGNDRVDGFLLDRQTRGIERISVDSNGQEYRFDSVGGHPTADGRRVVFNSSARLDPSIPWDYFEMGIRNAFVRNLAAGTTELLGRNSEGDSVRLGTTALAVLYGRGEVLLASGANLLGADGNTSLMQDVFVRNWQTGHVELSSPAFRSHLRAIIFGNRGDGHEQQALYG